jgi:hypothetical protein
MAPFCRPILEARMNKYKEGEIHFNLMGVVEDKIARYNRWMAVFCGHYSADTILLYSRVPVSCSEV